MTDKATELQSVHSPDSEKERAGRNSRWGPRWLGSGTGVATAGLLSAANTGSEEHPASKPNLKRRKRHTLPICVGSRRIESWLTK